MTNRIEIFKNRIKKYWERRKNTNPIKDWPAMQPFTRMGTDRGTPIDRIYIEKFLSKNKELIKGNILEIGDAEYTFKYGKSINKSYILTVDSRDIDTSRSEYIIGDLVTGEGIPCNKIDCFILTQTLPFIYDVKVAVKNSLKCMVKGGKILLTVPGVTSLSPYDTPRWGHYWSFSEQSVKKLFEEAGASEVVVKSWGNPKVASAFLYGLCAEDLIKSDFSHQDEMCPFLITAIVTK